MLKNLRFTISALIFILIWLFMMNKLKASPSEENQIFDGYFKSFHLMEIDSFDMEYRTHVNYRDAYFPKYETIDGKCTQSEECMKYGANALFDLDIISYKNYGLFWRNDVSMDATNKQVRHVAWDWEIGIPFTKHFELFRHHQSRHVLDDSVPETADRFPLRDEYVIKLKFYERAGRIRK